MTNAVEQASAFARLLFGTAPDNLWMLVWTPHDRISRWIPVGQWERVDTLATHLGYRPDPRNVYIGAGLLPANLGPKTRGKAEDRAGIPGVWIDIDYGTEAHEKTNLPANEMEAWEILTALPIWPTVVVHSGHGLQAWWLFHEFWVFEEPDEWKAAEALVRGWNATVRSTAEQRGWTVDSTWDLARIMRLPGTYNAKREPVVPVRIVHHDDERRYSVEEIEQYVQVEEAHQVPLDAPGPDPEPVTTGSLPDPLPEAPPFDKFQALVTNDEDFRRLWDRSRKLKDDSHSGYDMALANIAARAGWSDAEIAGLLIAHRRQHGGETKHRGYYERTIGKARISERRNAKEQRLDELYDEIELAGDEASRDKILEMIRTQTGIPVTRCIKVVMEQPHYRLVTENATIEVGTSETLMTQRLFARRMFDAASIYMPPMKADRWNLFMDALLRIMEEVDGGEENSLTGSVHDFISDYLIHRPEPVEWDEVLERVGTHNDVIAAKAPFTREGRLYIYSRDLLRFLINDGLRINKDKLAALLRAAGCEPRKLQVPRRDQPPTSTHVWEVPSSVYREFSA